MPNMLQTIIANTIYFRQRPNSKLSVDTRLQRHLKPLRWNHHHWTKYRQEYEEADEAASIHVRRGWNSVCHVGIFGPDDCTQNDLDCLSAPVGLDSHPELVSDTHKRGSRHTRYKP